MSYEFNKKKHHHSFGGKPLYGTTTVLGVINKPALISWSADMAVKHIEENFPTAEQIMNGFVFADLFKDARKAHTKRKTEAGVIGTDVHELIEDWIKHGTDYVGSDEQTLQMFNNFKEWATNNEVSFIDSERNVYSEVMWIGGIVDFVCIIGGKRYIGDIKTSSGIYPEHFLQMAAYDMCLQELGEPPAEAYVIVNIKKDGTYKTKERYDLDSLQNGFKHALGLYKTLQSIEI